MLLLAEIDLEQQIIQLATRTVLVAALALIILVVIAAAMKNKFPKMKLPLFILIALTMVGSTAILLGSTIYLNTKSESGGPVHWHADIEFWSCGAELDLRNPTGFLSNKIGTATYHEHNDKRIHLEGVVVRKSKDASLGKFMEVTGGYIDRGSVAIPLTADQSKWFAGEDQIDGDVQRPENFSLATGATEWIKGTAEGPVLVLQNGNYCSMGDELPAEVQVFVYKFDESANTYSQQKIDDPARYVIRDKSTVPPADCIIIEYDVPKSKTNKLCEQYGVRDTKRCTEFGVKAYNPDLCNAREVTSNTPHTSSSLPAASQAKLIEPCSDYLKHKGDPSYKPGLPSDQLANCEQFIVDLEKQCEEEAKNLYQGISVSCAKLQESR